MMAFPSGSTLEALAPDQSLVLNEKLSSTFSGSAASISSSAQTSEWGDSCSGGSSDEDETPASSRASTPGLTRGHGGFSGHSKKLETDGMVTKETVLFAKKLAAHAQDGFSLRTMWNIGHVSWTSGHRQEALTYETTSLITMRKRRVAFSTNTRADWVKLKPLAEILVENGFEVDVFVIGMHMIEEYGSTYQEIILNNRFRVFTRKTWSQGDSRIENALATMLTTYQLLEQSGCDLLIVHGDRLEAKAAADAAHLFGCRLGHVEGGDLTGGDDNKNRFAMTAMADYHFPSSQYATDRLLSTGQRAESIFTIGSPDLDVFLKSSSSVSLDEVLRKYNIPFTDFGVAPFHPNSAESESAGSQAENFYATLMASARNFIVPMPNNDKGTESVQNVLEALPRDRFCVVPNFAFDDYIVLIRNAGCVAGNSSVVVTAAPAIGKLCLNIGNRQRGRTPPMDGLFHFSAEDHNGIMSCLTRHWGASYRSKSHNGDGRAAERFLTALRSPGFWKVSQQKLLFDQKAY